MERKNMCITKPFLSFKVHSEKVHVIVQPGNYAVTAKKWDSNITETHVNVAGGATANLDFKL